MHTCLCLKGGRGVGRNYEPIHITSLETLDLGICAYLQIRLNRVAQTELGIQNVSFL